jgi:1-acyl-sn-glycerol-3-phosphate acyltransferase
MFKQLTLILRSALFYVGYVLATVVMSFFFILLFPLMPSRQRHAFAAAWCKFILGWLRLTCGISYEIAGTDNLLDRPAVYLSNHQSSWETLLFYSLIFPISPILKVELFKIPFWGWALRLLKPIAIDRSKPREAARSLLLQGEQRLKEGNSIIIFPEGTRSEPGTIRKFSRGGASLAVSADVPIVPIVHNAGYAWPARQFIKYPGTVSVEVGQAIQMNGRSVNELTETVEQWTREQFISR